jgi:HEAT repeat protein
MTMIIESESQAYHLLDDSQQPAYIRETAVKYLAKHVTPETIQHLTLALNDDDFGVHWEAAASLAQLGMMALPELLNALTKVELAASPRMREGAYHVLHYNSAPEVRRHAGRLMEALKGSSADLATLAEANRWLQKIHLEDGAPPPHHGPLAHHFNII